MRSGQNSIKKVDTSVNDKPESVRDLIGRYISEQCTVIIDSEAQLRAG